MQRRITLVMCWVISLILVLLLTQNNEKVSDQSILSAKSNLVCQRHDDLELDSENVSKNDVILTSQSPLDKNLLSFSYYKISFNGNNFYVADLTEINQDESINPVAEIKLIENCQYYNNFGEYQSLRQEKFVLEVINVSKESLLVQKNFSIVSNTDAEMIISKSMPIDVNDEKYYKILSSINFEYNYRQTVARDENEIEPMSTSDSDENTNEQGPLDYYLANTSNGSNTDTITVGTESQDGIAYASDDSIVKLIPKSYFKINGTHTGAGSEWGYLIKTYDDIGNNKNSSLIIYDIEQERFTTISNELTEITVVVHKNYKYYYDEDRVVGDIDNTYALANPVYKENIRYFQPNNVESSNKYLNPGDFGYDAIDDYGYSFGTTSAYYKGRGKNYNNYTVLPTILGLASTVLQAALIPSGIPIGINIAVSVLGSLITDSIISATTNLIREQNNSNLLTDSNDFNIASTTFFNNYLNYDYMRRDKKLLKEVNFLLSNGDGNFSYNELEEALLFKDNSCKISYKTSLVASEKSDDYNAIIAHNLKVDVINDNTWRPFHWMPEFIGTISGSWAYSFGQEFTPKTYNLLANGNYFNAAFSNSQKQKFKFKPENSGEYYLYFKELPPFIKVDVKQNNLVIQSFEVGYSSKKDAWGNNVFYKKKHTYKELIRLSKGSEYIFEIYANNGNLNVSGSCDIGISFNGGLISNSFLNSNNKSTTKSITYNKENQILQFNPSVDGGYLFSTSSNQTSSNFGTCITLFDKNFNIVFSSYDLSGESCACFYAHLKSGQTYYVSTRNYNYYDSNNFSLVIMNGTPLPEIRGTMINAGFNMIFKGAVRNSFLLYQSGSLNGNIRFEYLGENVGIKPFIYFNIVNVNGSIVYSNSFNYTKDFKYNFSSGLPYLINVYSTSTNTNDYINLFLN